MKVNILLSTYNGERFLREQVESIQAQIFTDWQLLIRDDGSNDSTREIIRDLVAQDSRIRFINAENSTNLGVIKSFHALLTYEKADYYLFSDQDDIWLPNKIATQLAEAQQQEQGLPIMVYTDLKVVNQYLEVQHESMIRTQSDHANTELLQELTENTVTGGVVLINHALARLWTGQEPNPILMHDWYLALLATAFGKLIYIDQPMELYRQHDSNVLGARTLQKRMRNWIRPQTLFAKYWKLIGDSQIQAKNLLEMDLTPKQKELIEQFVTIMEVPFLERLRRLRTYGYRKNRSFHTLVFTTLILTKFAYKEK